MYIYRRFPEILVDSRPPRFQTETWICSCILYVLPTVKTCRPDSIVSASVTDIRTQRRMPDDWAILPNSCCGYSAIITLARPTTRKNTFLRHHDRGAGAQITNSPPVTWASSCRIPPSRIALLRYASRWRLGHPIFSMARLHRRRPNIGRQHISAVFEEIHM